MHTLAVGPGTGTRPLRLPSSGREAYGVGEPAVGDADAEVGVRDAAGSADPVACGGYGLPCAVVAGYEDLVGVGRVRDGVA